MRDKELILKYSTLQCEKLLDICIIVENYSTQC